MRRSFSFFNAVMALALTPSALGQDLLEPLIVTASRTRENLFETPYTASIVDSNEWSFNEARTVPEALGDIPGIMVQKTTHGHGSPYIRGFTGRQNLYLVDGIRLNNSSWRSGPVQYANTLDPYAIDRLEVVKGHGSVLYGSDAIGGTLNAISKSSGFRGEDDARVFSHGAAAYRYDSNSESHIGRLESNFGVGEKFGITLGLSSKDYGDIRDSAVGLMRHTGYQEENLDAKIEVAISKDITLTLAHQYLNQDNVWRWHSTIYNPGWDHDGNVAAPGTFLSRIYNQERSLTYAKLEGETENGFIDRWSATVSYQRQDEAEFQARTLTDKRFQSFRVETGGAAFQLESDIGPGTAVYGADFYRDRVGSYGIRNGVVRDDFRPIADDSTYETLGIFGQYRWEPVKRLNLTAGSRYTISEARLGKYYDTATAGDRSAEKDWDQFVSSARALYEINGDWNVYGGISQGFRAPNLDDLSGNLTSRSGQTSLGNVDVEPEDFINYEIGTRHRSDCFSVGTAVFYTDIDNVITGVPVTEGSGTLVTTNGQDGYVYGIELEAAWEFAPHWTLSGRGSWQDGKTETPEYLGGPNTDQPVSRLLPLTGTLNLRWTSPSEDFWVEAEVTATDHADRLSAGDRTDTQRIPVGGTPGYGVASLRAGWQANDHLIVTLGLENLTDEDYRIHGSGQNEPGFNAIFGTRVIW